MPIESSSFVFCSKGDTAFGAKDVLDRTMPLSAKKPGLESRCRTINRRMQPLLSLAQ